jgi:hypothetical protein
MTEMPYHPAGDQAASHSERRPWVSPAVTELPKLTELTLQSGDPIGGGGDTGGGGSTVF